jgi:hypothetical protein
MATRQFRPILIGASYDALPTWKRINFKWVLQRLPMFLFAFVSSYGVGHLLALSGIPFPFDYIGAVSFDIGFLGVIALADMQLSSTFWSNVFFYVLNTSMAGLAALFNVLGHAGGKYANIRAEDITIGIPFAIVGLVFALYYHSIMRMLIDAEEKENQEQQQHIDATKEPCQYCGVGKPSKAAVYGHYKSCAQKKIHEDTTRTTACTCKLCTGSR